MKRTASFLAALLMAVLMTAGIPQGGLADSREPITSVTQLNDPSITIGVTTGTLSELSVAHELPRAKIASYTDVILGYMDVANGKIDAYVYDRVQMKKSIENGVSGVRILDDCLKERMEIAVGLSPWSGIPNLPEKMNQFIAELREAGILEDMYNRWVILKDDKMPDIPVPENPELALTVGTSGIVPPYSYYRGSELWGYDIELARRFAAWLNASLRLKVYDYSGFPSAMASGDIDCVMANLQKNPSREEQFPFSDVLYTEIQGILVRDDSTEKYAVNRDGTTVSLSQFSGKTVGVQTGTNFDDLTKKKIPDAEIAYYNAKADLAQALSDGKVAAIAMDDPVLRILRKTYAGITPVEEPLNTYRFGFAFAKTEEGDRLRDSFNEFLAEARTAGTLDKLMDKWFNSASPADSMINYSALPAVNGTLRMATESGYEPFEYVANGRVVGYDVELAALFCQARGYALEVLDMNFDAVLPSLAASKCEFAGAGISITPERAESVYFSDPTYEGSARLAVYAGTPEASSVSFLDSIRSSFEKTFVREDRWKLFLEGVITTLIITLSSALLGTALGFLLYLFCRRGNPAALRIASLITFLIQGMPMVVLLMVFYYLIFASVNISGVLVSIIAFSLTVGSAVYGMLQTGVGAVDGGQREAALALGYSDRRTFFKIILPQAMPHILPAYRGEMVGLIKATAVVGYIAVQDLTKMSDIVRSRTYEAFFPLIAITVIYFLLEGLLAFLVGRIHFNPKRRDAKSILKGVKTDDQH